MLNFRKFLKQKFPQNIRSLESTNIQLLEHPGDSEWHRTLFIGVRKCFDTRYNATIWQSHICTIYIYMGIFDHICNNGWSIYLFNVKCRVLAHKPPPIDAASVHVTVL